MSQEIDGVRKEEDWLTATDIFLFTAVNSKDKK
jgi:hypothetical protein